MKLSNLRVKTKLMLAFVTMAAVVLVVSGLSLNSLTNSNKRFTDYLAGVGTRERLAVEVQAAASARAIAARNLVLVTQPQERELEKAAVARAQQAMATSLAALKEAIAKDADATARDRQLISELDSIESKYSTVAGAIVGLALADKRDDAIAKMSVECRPLLAALLTSTQAFLEHDRAQAQMQLGQAASQFTVDRLLLAGVCALAALAAGLLGWALSNVITKPLARAVALAETVASGDLRSNIVVDRGDETGQLMAALKRMNDSLGAMVGSVRESADGIAIASKEIASGNQDLSGRTEQQASALQQTASSMQHMTDTVQHNADTSRQARSLAGSAAEVASQGGEVVQQMVQTMSEISASSQKIGDIIGVIDGIAFQTNILALNAAVEAARAGEQGRGFAVVAAEVRSLAQRSAAAAKEIKALISASVEKVESGSALAGVAGHTISDLVTRVRQMTDLIGEISASTSAQSTGISQVNQAVASIDQGTQQNAALVEQSAAAAESLMQQASGLLAVIARFKVAPSAAHV